MLKFCIYGQKMELINRQTIADQQICFVDMCFLFSPDWEQMDKTAQFAQGEKTYNACSRRSCKPDVSASACSAMRRTAQSVQRPFP